MTWRGAARHGGAGHGAAGQGNARILHTAKGLNMTTLYETIRDAAAKNPEASPTEIAKQLLKRLSHEELVNLLANEIARFQRNDTRGIERRVFGKMANLVPLISNERQPLSRRIVSNDLSALQPLLPKRFVLQGGVRVSWAEATTEQHRMRIEFLEKRRDGINTTISQHENAIEIIEAAGVECLGQLNIKSAA